MPTTLRCSMIARGQCRSYTYSTKKLKSILDGIGWEYKITPPATMIIHLWKTFPDRTAAVLGRKELDETLRNRIHPNVGYRIDKVEEN